MNTHSKDKTSILVFMDKELKKDIFEVAKKDGRSATNLINFVMKQYIDKEKENDRKTIS